MSLSTLVTLAKRGHPKIGRRDTIIHLFPNDEQDADRPNWQLHVLHSACTLLETSHLHVAEQGAAPQGSRTLFSYDDLERIRHAPVPHRVPRRTLDLRATSRQIG